MARKEAYGKVNKSTYISAQQFYELLLEDGLRGSAGRVDFTLNNITVEIQELDAIGHLIQEWILGWATTKGIELSRNPRSQEFPDYFLNGVENKTEGLLEIKSFNFKAGPAFDVADFFEYVDYLKDNPAKIYADYLVIGYEVNESNGESVIVIKNVWLKKIWELVGYSKTNYITCQIRTSNEVRRPYKIRPTTFHKRGKTFDSAKGFLVELQKLLNENDITAGHYDNWFERVDEAHRNFYGENIE